MSIRKVIIVFEHEKPHNHPVLPAMKASISVKNLYRDCIAAAGLVGSSVGKVDNGEINDKFVKPLTDHSIC